MNNYIHVRNDVSEYNQNKIFHFHLIHIYEVKLHKSYKFWQNLRIFYCLTYAIKFGKDIIFTPL